ncbi:hypothetical protein [Streptomyces nigrescens]|uniref:hypothetical protein n=1 Tax=Streptomyces nigrescens TaxID=1920 RepID=UPI003812B012
MSYIYVTEYSGAADEYAYNDGNPGDKGVEHVFGDGEALRAASLTISLLDAGKHFDVRQERY